MCKQDETKTADSPNSKSIICKDPGSKAASAKKNESSSSESDSDSGVDETIHTKPDDKPLVPSTKQVIKSVEIPVTEKKTAMDKSTKNTANLKNESSSSESESESEEETILTKSETKHVDPSDEPIKTLNIINKADVKPDKGAQVEEHSSSSDSESDSDTE